MMKNLLYRLGIPATYLGHRYVLSGVSLALVNEDVLSTITTILYPTIAAQFCVTPVSVDRALRTAITECWERGNRPLLDEVAGRKLRDKPTAGDFIAILTEYARTHPAEDRPTACL